MTVAMTTIEALRRESQSGCVTCGIFSSAIQRLAKEDNSNLGQAWDSFVRLEFQMSYLGHSLALYVIDLGMHVSFFSSDCKSKLDVVLI